MCVSRVPVKCSECFRDEYIIPEFGKVFSRAIKLKTKNLIKSTETVRFIPLFTFGRLSDEVANVCQTNRRKLHAQTYTVFLS